LHSITKNTSTTLESDITSNNQNSTPKSGKYNGFYVQNGIQYSMGVIFYFNNGKINGDGNDIVGNFTFNGTYDSYNKIYMIKKYNQKGNTIEYSGIYMPQETKITGAWNFPGVYNMIVNPFEFILQ